MRYLGPLDRIAERRRLPLFAPDPYASSVFASSFAAVEQFNPQRYYAETGMTSQSLPTGTTGPQTGGATAPAPPRIWVIIGVIAVVIWALERHKLKLKGVLT
jgi:hypothetical protein